MEPERIRALVDRALASLDDPRVVLEIGVALLGQEEAVAALRVFERGHEAAPAVVELELGVASALLQLERFEEARRHLERHLERVPGSAGGQLQLAICERQLGHPEGALRAVLRAIHLDPNDRQSLELFVSLHEDPGALESAQEALQRMAADLRCAGPYLALARLALADAPEQAEVELERAIERIDATDGQLFEDAAEMLLALDRPQECIDLLALSESPSFRQELALAHAYLRCGEAPRARGLLRQLERGVDGPAARAALDALALALRDA